MLTFVITYSSSPSCTLMFVYCEDKYTDWGIISEIFNNSFGNFFRI